MAKRKMDPSSQSGFIREQLTANPEVKHRAVAEAWAAAGHPGEIKSSLFYLVKSKMLKGSKKKRGRPEKSIAAVALPAQAEPSADDPSKAFHEIERALDSLIHQASQLRDANLAHELRVARRRVSAQLM